MLGKRLLLTLPQSLTEINAHNAKDHGNALRRRPIPIIPCALDNSATGDE